MLDGLETVFLTLLSAIDQTSDRGLYEHGCTVWDRYGALARVVGAGPVGFYGVNSKAFFLFSRANAEYLRRGGANAELITQETELPGALAKLGGWTIQNPFQRQARSREKGRGLALVHPQVMYVRSGEISPEQKGRKAAHAAAATAVAIGVMLEFVPNPEAQAVGAGILIGALAVEAIWAWDEVFKGSEKPKKEPGSSLDISTPEIEPADGVLQGGDNEGSSEILTISLTSSVDCTKATASGATQG